MSLTVILLKVIQQEVLEYNIFDRTPKWSLLAEKSGQESCWLLQFEKLEKVVRNSIKILKEALTGSAYWIVASPNSLGNSDVVEVSRGTSIFHYHKCIGKEIEWKTCFSTWLQDYLYFFTFTWYVFLLLRIVWTVSECDWIWFCRWLSMTVDDCWWLLMTVDDWWWLSMTTNDCQRLC